MKRTLFYAILIIAILFVGIYILLFSQPGNNILRPVIEHRLDAKIPGKLRLTDFRLTPSTFRLSINIDKNLSLKVGGKINIFSRSVNGKYSLIINNLATLTILRKNRLYGKLTTKGTISGNSKTVYIKGISALFGGRTEYKFAISNLKTINSITINTRSGRLSNLFALKKIPAYLSGLFDAIIALKVDKSGVKGAISIVTHNGRFNRIIINRYQRFKINKDYKFSFLDKTNITGNVAKNNITFKSDLAKVSSKNLSINLISKKIEGKYSAVVDDLRRFEFITGKPVRGYLVATGVINNRNNLIAGDLRIPAGSIKYHLKNGIFDAFSDRISISKLLYMFFYPQVFRSEGKIKLLYNLKKKRGKFSGIFKNGRIQRGRLTDLIRAIAHFDITKELYSSTVINGDFLKSSIVANLDMKSRATELSSQKSVINTNDNSINSTLNIRIKNSRLTAKIHGKLNRPNVTIDASGLIRSKIKKRLDKVIKDKILKGILNKLF